MTDIALQDTVRALRVFRQAPGYSVSVVLTLTLALGAAAALFCLLDALVLRSIRVPQPGALASLARLNPQGQVRWLPVTLVAEFERRQRVFKNLCGYAGGGVFTARVGRSVSAVSVEFVTGRYYDVLEVRPALGRLLSPQDSPLTGEPSPVAVIGDRYWRRTLGADPAAMGSTIRVEGLAFTIVGVTPPDVSVQTDVAADITLPLAFLDRLDGDDSAQNATPNANYILGRLRDGLSLDQAQAATQQLWPSVQAESTPPDLDAQGRDEFNSAWPRVESLARGFSFLRTRYGNPLQTLAWLVGGLVVLTCLNLSGLSLARAMARLPDLRVRLMIGARLKDVLRLVLLEMSVLALTGIGLALPLALWATSVIVQILWSGALPITLDVTPGARALALVIGVAIVLTVVAAALPALVIVRSSRRRTTATTSTVIATRRWQRALVVGQVAISVALLLPASQLAHTLTNLRALDSGLDLNNVITARLVPQPGGYRDLNEAAYYPELIARLKTLPAVQSVSLSHLFPSIVNTAATLRTVTRVDAASAPVTRAAVDVVSPDFFRTVGIRLVTGRGFTWDDDTKHPLVVVINSSLGEKLLPGVDPIGARIRVGTSKTPLQIVGIVADACLGDVRASHVPTVFRPTLQQPAYARSPAVQVRSSRNPLAVAGDVRRTVAALGREHVLTLRGLAEQIDASMANERVAAGLSGYLAALATLLAGLGMFGLLAYSVAQREREFGLRMALGASRSALVISAAVDAIIVTVAGLGIGVPLAFAVGRTIRGLLFGVEQVNLWALAEAVALMTFVAALAAAIPVLRAVAVNPAAMLRNE
jgi:putative ABC transport system permease protein